MHQEILYILLIIALGYLLKRLNILQETDGEAVSRILFNVTLPALVLVTFDTVKIEAPLIYLPARSCTDAWPPFSFLKEEQDEDDNRTGDRKFVGARSLGRTDR